MCNYKLKENKMKRLIHTEESLILQKRIDLLKKKKDWFKDDRKRDIVAKLRYKQVELMRVANENS
tara:strand:+ start:217 stop:411 length:195 start_codon:yes stop_codon:yes gene_type:complete